MDTFETYQVSQLVLRDIKIIFWRRCWGLKKNKLPRQLGAVTAGAAPGCPFDSVDTISFSNMRKRERERE
jgi:hypothetical protein